MTPTPHTAGHFVVSAKRREGFIQQTRKVASSAVDLAQSWRNAGHTDITIVDPNGRPVTPGSDRQEALRRQEWVRPMEIGL